jgi:hypothetical protein
MQVVQLNSLLFHTYKTDDNNSRATSQVISNQ